jgi:2-C-methyl-D-erythritol 4-phosphate cytidylyltransferase / 2-C-methyl-D-erythritol 2,4-cyclodiphosphate synthase
VLRRCLEAFNACAEIDQICLVTAPERLEACVALSQQWGIGKLTVIVPGGDTRSQSVYNGLKALPSDCEIVAIQDGARPFTTTDIIARSIHSAKEKGSGVAAIKCRDTIKVADGSGQVDSTPDRCKLWLIQTPQTFRYDMILHAYEQALETGAETTDDAAMVELEGGTVFLTEGSVDNIKLTTPEDICHGEAIINSREGKWGMMSIGEGYDVHRLVEGRALVLGGVDIPHGLGLLGHSDADVLVHAIMDALLGAAGLGDIGRHFPDNDDAYKGISSLLLLKRIAVILENHGCRVGNIDATVVAQRPKLAPHIPQMQGNIARCLGIPTTCVNIKATTTEKLGFEGSEEGMSARAVVLIYK